MKAAKPSAGRKTSTQPGPKHVETLPCPEAGEGGTHELWNDRDAVARCVHCRATWAALDAEARRTA